MTCKKLAETWAIVCERQHSLHQFIFKFLLLFKKWEMAGIVKPDKFLLGALMVCV
jgi:hypothetical protein